MFFKLPHLLDFDPFLRDLWPVECKRSCFETPLKMQNLEFCTFFLLLKMGEIYLFYISLIHRKFTPSLYSEKKRYWAPIATSEVSIYQFHFCLLLGNTLYLSKWYLLVLRRGRWRGPWWRPRAASTAASCRRPCAGAAPATSCPGRPGTSKVEDR